MLRSGLIRASMGAAVSLLAGGCSGAAPPVLPSLPQITGALSESPAVGPPTEVYARVARGAMACWFGTAGPLKKDYVYHAEAQPPAQGGKAEIVIHERDRTSENPRGLRAFRIAIAPDGEASSLAVENLKLPEPLAKSMQEDVRRWAAGAIGCTGADRGWAPRSPEAPQKPKRKPRAQKGAT
jgi:hypothetical protein